MSIIGKRIKDMRVNKSMTQEELGQLLGVKKAAIQKYENGTITNFKADTIKKLCDIFNEPPYKFIWDNLEDFDMLTLRIAENNPNGLRQTFKIHENPNIVALMDLFSQLNKEAQLKIIDYATDISKIAKYSKDNS